MNYTELNKNAEDRISNCPIFFAFSDKQFAEGCKKLSVEVPKEELTSIGGGGFIKKTDTHIFKKAIEDNEKERKEFFMDMRNLQDAFKYELGNHEYCITGDDQETWEAVGLDWEDNTQEQRQAYVTAKEHYFASVNY